MMSILMSGLGLICIILTLPCMQGYPLFKDEIPNGHNVKNPFYDPQKDQRKIWRGVGHLALEGGGSQNPFGLAFKANGYISFGINFLLLKFF